jgi:hypothetical protein
MPTHYAVNPQTGERLMLMGGKWVAAAPSKTATNTAGKPTEDQGKSQTYAKLMSTGEQQYEQAIHDGYNPAGVVTSFARAIEDKPVIGGLAPILRNDAADRGRAAERLFQDAQLKAMTGAGQSAQEARDTPRTYFPGWGEGEGTAKQKRAARQAAFESAVARAGPLAANVANPFATSPTPKKAAGPKTQGAGWRIIP